MRWDRLFDDLASQLDHEQREEERVLAIESERLRIARLGLRDRLTAMAAADADGAGVRLQLAGGRPVALNPTTFGRDWISGPLVGPGAPAHCVVPLSAIAAVLADRRQVEESLEPVPAAAGRIAERIGLAFVLRDLSRRRVAVEVDTLDGRHHGTVDRVARDHLDLAMHDPGTPRRDRDVRGFRLVPFARLVCLVVR